MYTQFFGNFLLSRGVVTSEQLINAIKEESTTHIKLGTLAIHAGYMTASEADNIIIMQTHEDKRFGELAVQGGYMTEEQVNSLLKMQKPDYLLLGQILIEQGILTNTDFENLIVDYQSEYEIYDLDMATEKKEVVTNMLKNYCSFSNHPQGRQGDPLPLSPVQQSGSFYRRGFYHVKSDPLSGISDQLLHQPEDTQ